ncbi:hypothetical protein [Thiomonas sp.]|uniref:hypothetical protein n=1 Tax=Thiomonas sp. TaxID=2047785 RepID=UPI0026374823|nr:hypothetical protein [Thiomonas sp.]
MSHLDRLKKQDLIFPCSRMLGLLAATALLLTACATPQEVIVQRESTQAFAPTSLVAVLPRLPADQPYVRIAVLDAQAPAGTPVAQILAQLQTKAGQLGANAIVVQDLSTKEGGTVQYNPSGGEFTTTPAIIIPHLRAIAIRISFASSLEKP